MISAVVCGIFGTLLTYLLGSHFFGFGPVQVLWAVAASNVSGFVALLLTLALERREPVRRILMGNALKAWLVLAFLYTGGNALLDPDLRDATRMIVLYAPLIFSNGLMLPAWGKAQDAIIGWEYRRKRARQSLPHPNPM